MVEAASGRPGSLDGYGIPGGQSGNGIRALATRPSARVTTTDGPLQRSTEVATVATKAPRRVARTRFTIVGEPGSRTRITMRSKGRKLRPTTTSGCHSATLTEGADGSLPALATLAEDDSAATATIARAASSRDRRTIVRATRG